MSPNARRAPGKMLQDLSLNARRAPGKMWHDLSFPDSSKELLHNFEFLNVRRVQISNTIHNLSPNSSDEFLGGCCRICLPTSSITSQIPSSPSPPPLPDTPPPARLPPRPSPRASPSSSNLVANCAVSAASSPPLFFVPRHRSSRCVGAASAPKKKPLDPWTAPFAENACCSPWSGETPNLPGCERSRGSGLDNRGLFYPKLQERNSLCQSVLLLPTR